MSLLRAGFRPIGLRIFSSTSNGLKAIIHAPIPAPVLLSNSSNLHGESIDDLTREALGKLRSQQPRIYAKVLVNDHPFLVTPYDLILNHRMPDLKLGDIVRLDRVLEIGTRDYTLKGQRDALIDPRFFEITATVMEHGRGEKQKAKAKRLKKIGRKRNLTIKPRMTVLRIQDIKINRV